MPGIGASIRIGWAASAKAKSLDNVVIGRFGSRVFEARPIGDNLEDEDKICCRGIQLIRELKPEEVTDQSWCYQYCRYREDRPEVWEKITNSKWAYRYCHHIKDRPEIRKYITSPIEV